MNEAEPPRPAGAVDPFRRQGRGRCSVPPSPASRRQVATPFDVGGFVEAGIGHRVEAPPSACNWICEVSGMMTPRFGGLGGRRRLAIDFGVHRASPSEPGGKRGRGDLVVEPSRRRTFDRHVELQGPRGSGGHPVMLVIHARPPSSSSDDRRSHNGGEESPAPGRLGGSQGVEGGPLPLAAKHGRRRAPRHKPGRNGRGGK